MLYSTIIAERWSKEEILRYYSEYDIYSKYIGSNFKIGKAFSSPLREDKSPSFSIYVHKNDGTLMWKDHSTGDGGDVFKFVKCKCGLRDQREALYQVSRDFLLNKTYPPPKLPPKPKHINKGISITRKAFTKADLEYWQQYGINEEILKTYNVSALSAFFVNGLLQDVNRKGQLMFGWKVFNAFKIYRPLADKEDKWRSSLSVYDIQGFEQLDEEGDLLIITKSLKDVMLLRVLGYNAISPPCETSTVPEIIMANLKKRFKRIVMFYDNDTAGQKGASKIAKEYNLDNMCIPLGQPKDITDYYKANGVEKSALLIKELLQTN